MLQMPAKGFQRSINKHNVDLSIMADWVEASATFHDESITGAALVDILIENHIYAEQGFAWELIGDVFSLIKNRANVLGDGYPLQVNPGSRVTPKGNWNDFIPYNFCLTLSLCEYFPSWAKTFGSNFQTQGQLFEDLTRESVESILEGWKVIPTGWTRTNANQLNRVVTNVANALGESTGHLSRWTRDKANDAGLDLVCYRPFKDGRVGFPAFLIQCASGADWPTKLKTPDLRIWTKIVQFAADPKRGFSTPFALAEGPYTIHCNSVDGLLLDRYRLLSPGEQRQAWISQSLDTALNAWINSRVGTLPTLQ